MGAGQEEVGRTTVVGQRGGLGWVQVCSAVGTQCGPAHSREVS